MCTLFVEADEPLLVFPSVKVAERYLEAIDVRDGVYRRAFDRLGQQFSITTAGNRVIILSANAPRDPDGLEALLRRSLTAVGEAMPHTASLPELIAAAEEFWVERDPMDDRFSKPMPWWGCLSVLATVIALLWLLLR